MKKITLLIGFLGLLLSDLQAQNYLISFTGTGASNTVDSVKVENITQCTSVEFAGTDTLLLGATAGINDLNLKNDETLLIFPNPFTMYCNIEFESVISGNASIAIYDNMGKKIVETQHDLQQGKNRFQINGLTSGVYFINIRSKVSSYNGIVVSTWNGTGTPKITLQQESLDSRKDLTIKRMNTVIQMQYNSGDMLKITGISNIYRTIVMLVPISSQTVAFNFVACTDADGNNYAVVQIGTQLWMEENLKTLKYQDNSNIPNVTDSASWGNLTTGAWCNYHNDTLEGAIYGHLYNYYAVEDTRNICPFGWRVPSDADWRILENFLGDSVVAGQKMKENCTTRWEYNDTTWGTNSSGFTGLCANYRNASGSWSMAPDNNHDSNFWTSTVDVSSFAWFRGLRWCYNDVFRAPAIFNSGFSLRCVK
jgi:uncharacterized protein (TIGR02145 family)